MGVRPTEYHSVSTQRSNSMKVKAEVTINASQEAIWNVITDIDGAVDRISAIESVNVLDRPESGLLGLKWEETRIMFGKSAKETMWITDAVENEYYQTRAESHGAIYISGLRIEAADGANKLIMEFDGEAQTLGGRIMSFLMGWLLKGFMVKAIQQDLNDIKSHLEGQS